MDFETLGTPLPRHAGTSPYDAVPFQWSVHVQQRPGAEPRHQEFLPDDENDPAEAFVRSLLDVVEDVDGHVVVYNQGFEKGCLRKLAARLPQFAERIERLCGRIWDLLPVMRNGVYEPGFGGSFSLKTVAPALLPELSYEGMALSRGDEAGGMFLEMLALPDGSADRGRLRQALLDYCRQDTLVMVRLVDFLRGGCQ
jgi:predicted RecB family nuclease